MLIIALDVHWKKIEKRGHIFLRSDKPRESISSWPWLCHSLGSSVRKCLLVAQHSNDCKQLAHGCLLCCAKNDRSWPCGTWRWACPKPKTTELCIPHMIAGSSICHTRLQEQKKPPAEQSPAHKEKQRWNLDLVCPLAPKQTNQWTGRPRNGFARNVFVCFYGFLQKMHCSPNNLSWSVRASDIAANCKLYFTQIDVWSWQLHVYGFNLLIARSLASCRKDSSMDYNYLIHNTGPCSIGWNKSPIPDSTVFKQI